MKLGTEEEMAWRAFQNREWNRRHGKMFIAILMMFILLGSIALAIFLSTK